MHSCELITNLRAKKVLCHRVEVVKNFRCCNHRLCFLLCDWLSPNSSLKSNQLNKARGIGRRSPDLFFPRERAESEHEITPTKYSVVFWLEIATESEDLKIKNFLGEDVPRTPYIAHSTAKLLIHFSQAPGLTTPIFLPTPLVEQHGKPRLLPQSQAPPSFSSLAVRTNSDGKWGGAWEQG